jgi:hypothetical protein
MSEVEITCLGDSAHIRDLGLKMTRGSKIRTSLSAISNSRDLEDAKARGLVSVSVMKAQTIRREDLPIMPPPPIEPSANHQKIARSSHQSGSGNPHTEGHHDPHSTELLRELLLEIRGLREDMRKRQPEPKTDQLAAAIANAVRGALSGLQFGSGGGTVASLSSEPEERFIPRGIVSGSTKTDIETINSVAPSTSGLDDASGALRNARRQTKEG